MRSRPIGIMILILLVAVTAGCRTSPQPAQAPSPQAPTTAGAITLTLGAYTTPREAYAKLIPLFQQKWKAQTGQDVNFDQSYLGSGAQSRAIVEGFEADVTALSLEADIERIVKANLITHDWRATPSKGMVSTSVVAFAVRKGNPKGIRDWADLAKAGIEVLTPNPKTSGGAMWNILALYGAALRGYVSGVPKGNPQSAEAFLRAVLKNVSVMDKGARESITNFEKGVGDVAITYENEVVVGREKGQDYELVIPRSTILIENPVAVVDKYVDKHGTRRVAEAFVAFLMSKEAQEVFAQFGLRSVDPSVAKATAARYPKVTDLWTIQFLGGWKQVTTKFFGDQGIYTQAIAKVQTR